MTNQTKDIWLMMKDKISSLRRSRDYQVNLQVEDEEEDDFINGFEEDDNIFE